ncbi:MAG: GTP-binding protein, partial [Candidatus Hydrothermia bacterium]
KGERTLFFDFLPVEIKLPGGFKVRFHLYTVPGQFFYKASRRLVLRGADGLVYVADSSASRMESNLQILVEMVQTLRDYNNPIDRLPLVMQYNKRDASDALPVSELEAKLNKWNVPHVESIAINGVGVFQTLDLITKTVLKDIKEKAGVK